MGALSSETSNENKLPANTWVADNDHHGICNVRCTTKAQSQLPPVK